MWLFDCSLQPLLLRGQRKNVQSIIRLSLFDLVSQSFGCLSFSRDVDCLKKRLPPPGTCDSLTLRRIISCESTKVDVNSLEISVTINESFAFSSYRFLNRKLIPDTISLSIEPATGVVFRG